MLYTWSAPVLQSKYARPRLREGSFEVNSAGVNPGYCWHKQFTAVETKLSGKKILIIDDDVALVASLSAGLGDEGFAVVSVNSGEEALDSFRRESPDLVILDLMLPGLDGMTVCRMLRRSSPVPVIMLTAKNDDVDKIVGLEVGADDYVTKPFSFRELLARVKSALRRPEMDGYDVSEKPDVSSIGSLTIDFSRREVRAEGRLVVLPLKEYELLGVMARKPGRVFERDDLLCRIWGDDFYGEEKTLDVHIRRLRAKIEPDPANPVYLLTVRGVGYKLAEV
jgi:two-component system, OmpR family, response regulator RegX3